MLEVIAANAVTYLAGSLIKRASLKRTDQFLVFIGAVQDDQAALKDIQAKLNQIEATLSRLESKIDALLLTPLFAGFAKLKELPRLPESLQDGNIQAALNDFNTVIATPYSGAIGEDDMVTFRAMAFFGKAAALNCAGAGNELIAETAFQGFLLNSKIAKNYMSQKAWAETAEIAFDGCGLIDLTISIPRDPFHDEYKVEGKVRFKKENGEFLRFGGKKSLKFSKGWRGDESRKGTGRWLKVPDGAYTVDVESIVSHYNDPGARSFNYPRIDEFPVSASFELSVMAGFLQRTDIDFHMRHEGFLWQDRRLFIRTYAFDGTPIDTSSDRYQSWMMGGAKS